MYNSFLGHPFPYWVELEADAKRRGVAELYKEIADLRAKLSFYESRLDDINKFRNLTYVYK